MHPSPRPPRVDTPFGPLVPPWRVSLLPAWEVLAQPVALAGAAALAVATAVRAARARPLPWWWTAGLVAALVVVAVGAWQVLMFLPTY